MYTDETSMRTPTSSTEQHICQNPEAVTLSMIHDTHLQQRTHTGGENGRFRDFQKNKKVAGSEVEPPISKNHIMDPTTQKDEFWCTCGLPKGRVRLNSPLCVCPLRVTSLQVGLGF